MERLLVEMRVVEYGHHGIGVENGYTPVSLGI